MDESWIDDFISKLNKGTSKNIEHSSDESDIVSTNVSEIIEVSREDDLISESEKTLKNKVEYWNVDIISEMESMNFSENKYESCIKDIISELDKTLKNEVKYWNVDIIS